MGIMDILGITIGGMWIATFVLSYLFGKKGL
nr:MAG TPA: hypothetical protein [Caudoviricetes sp.]DAO95085.1 MAG TPA: hypothetical protein [Caudoviricetes sp.]DAS12816.1 MAG TPA: hypothetical protein [Bacteriophage sp.]